MLRSLFVCLCLMTLNDYMLPDSLATAAPVQSEIRAEDQWMELNTSSRSEEPIGLISIGANGQLHLHDTPRANEGILNPKDATSKLISDESDTSQKLWAAQIRTIHDKLAAGSAKAGANAQKIFHQVVPMDMSANWCLSANCGAYANKVVEELEAKNKNKELIQTTLPPLRSLLHEHRSGRAEELLQTGTGDNPLDPFAGAFKSANLPIPGKSEGVDTAVSKLTDQGPKDPNPDTNDFTAQTPAQVKDDLGNKNSPLGAGPAEVEAAQKKAVSTLGNTLGPETNENPITGTDLSKGEQLQSVFRQLSGIKPPPQQDAGWAQFQYDTQQLPINTVGGTVMVPSGKSVGVSVDAIINAIYLKFIDPNSGKFIDLEQAQSELRKIADKQVNEDARKISTYVVEDLKIVQQGLREVCIGRWSSTKTVTQPDGTQTLEDATYDDNVNNPNSPFMVCLDEAKREDPIVSVAYLRLESNTNRQKLLLAAWEAQNNNIIPTTSRLQLDIMGMAKKGLYFSHDPASFTDRLQSWVRGYRTGFLEEINFKQTSDDKYSRDVSGQGKASFIFFRRRLLGITTPSPGTPLMGITAPSAPVPSSGGAHKRHLLGPRASVSHSDKKDQQWTMEKFYNMQFGCGHFETISLHGWADPKSELPGRGQVGGNVIAGDWLAKFSTWASLIFNHESELRDNSPVCEYIKGSNFETVPAFGKKGILNAIPRLVHICVKPTYIMEMETKSGYALKEAHETETSFSTGLFGGSQSGSGKHSSSVELGNASNGRIALKIESSEWIPKIIGFTFSATQDLLTKCYRCVNGNCANVPTVDNRPKCACRAGNPSIGYFSDADKSTDTFLDCTQCNVQDARCVGKDSAKAAAQNKLFDTAFTAHRGLGCVQLPDSFKPDGI